MKTPVCWESDRQSAAEYDVMMARNVMAPMRDGSRLAADIYLPAHGCRPAAGPHPTLLIRTPYDKTPQRETGEFFARRGYVFVAQDVRGRYASEGRFFAFADEGEDGFDSVEWIAAQPWCNGHIGTLGASYCAAAQSALGSLAPPHLGAMIVQFGPSSYYHSSMRHNGALEQRFLVYAFSMALTSREAAANAQIRTALTEACKHVWDYVAAGPLRPGDTPLALVPSYEQWALEISRRGCYDPFWQRPGFGPRPHYEQHADVPTLYVGGWYDTYPRGTIENFLALGKGREDRVHLLMGPWHHGGVGQAEAGDGVFNSSAAIPFQQVQLRWFDHWLKGYDNGVAAEPPVTYFIMGVDAEPAAVPKGRIALGGRWHTAETWPPPGAQATPYYFHHDGTLSCRPPEPGEPETTTYIFDPDRPVPTIGGNLSAMPLPAGAFDQRGDPRFGKNLGELPLSARPDVLVFRSNVLSEPLTAAGPLTARLLVATDGPDTDFTVKLLDEYPPSEAHPAGAAVIITDSIGRLRFRESCEQETPAVPGQVYLLEVCLYPTAHRFAAGHRIRVDVSSSNYPRFDVNPNTGGPLGVERRRRVAQNCLYHSAAHPSCLVLSLLSSPE